MVMLGLRYDLRLPGGSPEARTRLLDTALEQIRWGDERGFTSVTLSEHHGSVDGYLPSPIVFGAAVASRTSSVLIHLGAVIAPLHDPLRLAEDLAVLDLLSGGRLLVTVGAGYVGSEFAMFDRDPAGRAAAVERTVETLKRAWTGEPFEYGGRTVRVTPRPFQQPRPMILLGGSSARAARRAARIADGYLPSGPESFDAYRAAVVELGRPDPGPCPPPGPRFVYVAEDPERAWARVGPSCLYEMNAYGAWAVAAGLATGYHPVADLDELAATGAYPVVTPEQCVELARRHGTLVLHPLCGGMDPELSWASLELIEQRVMPVLAGSAGAG